MGRCVRRSTLAAAVVCLCHAFAGTQAWLSWTGSNAANRQQRPRNVALQARKEPWKPLVFKMPRKKPPRETIADDDGFTTKMRQRVQEMELTKELSDSEVRAVSETKAEDIVSKEFDDAKISANYALWVVDRTHDAAIEERDRPDLDVWKRRYDTAAQKLDKRGQREPKETQLPEASTGPTKGRINLMSMDSMDEMIERHAEAAKAEELQKKLESMSVGKALKEGESVSKEDEKTITSYLENLQQRSATETKISRRVVKSPEQRREDYEETKGSLVLTTLALGMVGTGVAFALYGVNEAFSFGLGSFAALMYISGLSSYTDNAESPIGMAVGGRRFLVPVILLLLVIQWDSKLEVVSPEIASLGLDPVLPAAILGFFTYNLGKILSGALR
mmetsp:Transcript_65088/g.121292  ORF Transcript_65088/g.121292 Transcript_65088/m.121292 type:complete len:390 (-) Transcript_65088:104-1273(-)